MSNSALGTHKKSRNSGIVLDVILKAALIVSLLPFFTLILYTHPQYVDDYVNLMDGKTLGLIPSIKHGYMTIAGYYTSLSLIQSFALFIDKLGVYVQGYKFGVFALYSMIVFALYSLIRVGTSEFMTKKASAFVAFAVSAIYVVTIPWIHEGFFWLPAGIIYLSGPILLILLVSLAASSPSFARRNIPITILCCLLAALAAGSAIVTVPPLLLVVLVCTTLAIRTSHPTAFLWKCVLTVSIVSSVIVIVAPGNYARLHLVSSSASNLTTEHNFQLLRSLRVMLMATGQDIVRWSTNTTLLAATLLMFPFISKIAPRARLLQLANWRYTLIAAAIGPALVIATYAPYLWVTGELPVAPRVRNHAYLLFIAWWLITAALAMAAYTNKSNDKPPLPAWLLHAAKIVVILSLLSHVTFTRMLTDALWRGPRYDKEMKERNNLIQQAKARGERNIRLPRLQFTPITLLLRETPSDPNNRQNRALARYWGVDTIATLPANTSTRQTDNE